MSFGKPYQCQIELYQHPQDSSSPRTNFGFISSFITVIWFLLRTTGLPKTNLLSFQEDLKMERIDLNGVQVEKLRLNICNVVMVNTSRMKQEDQPLYTPNFTVVFRDYLMRKSFQPQWRLAECVLLPTPQWFVYNPDPEEVSLERKEARERGW